MRESLYEAGQIIAASTAIGGSFAGLIKTDPPVVIQVVLYLFMATATGVIASIIVRRALLHK